MKLRLVLSALAILLAIFGLVYHYVWTRMWFKWGLF